MLLLKQPKIQIMYLSIITNSVWFKIALIFLVIVVTDRLTRASKEDIEENSDEAYMG